MKRTLLVSSLIAPLSLLAQDIETSLGKNRALVLRGQNCEHLLKQQQAICDWKKQVEPGFEPKSAMSCSTVNGKKQVTILECLPKIIRDNHEKKLQNSGPNCWGTTMQLKEISLAPRFIWSEEMNYWIDSPLCRKLSSDEPRLPGDVMNVYGPEYVFEYEMNENSAGTRFRDALDPKRYQAPKREGYSGFHRLFHSVTYITDDLSYGKNSPAYDDRFFFHSSSQVYARPSYDQTCVENQNLSPNLRIYDNKPTVEHGTKCKYFSTLSRCERFDDYFAKQDLSAEEKNILANVNELQKIQETLFGYVTTPGKVLSKSVTDLIVINADLVAKKALEEIQKGKMSKTREMLLALEYFTAAALRKSLEQAEVIPPTETL